jgi:hypothetical protein
MGTPLDVFRAMILLIVVLSPGAVRAQACNPYWRAGPQASTNHHFVQFDDGTGNTVYTTRTNPPSVYRWAGAGWQALPTTGLPAQTVTISPRVFDDGSGPALYLLMRVSLSPQITAAFKWNGAKWMQMPTSFYTLQVEPFDSGDVGEGSHIYGRAWSNFGTPGLYRWSGASWDLIATMDYRDILGLFTFGGDLYMVGSFFNVAGVPNQGVVRWDGQQWYSIPGVMGRAIGGWASVEFDDGTGPAVFLTSLILDPVGWNPQFYPGLFKFDGQQFTAVGYTHPPPPLQGSWVLDLKVFDDGRGPAIYIGGGFPQFGMGSNIVACNGIVRWHPQTGFEPLGVGGSNTAFIGEVQAPFGRSLFVGQEFPGSYGGGFARGSALWVPCPNCYSNCDDSEIQPRLNIADFTCFLQKYARLDPYANCNVDATIDIADFQCFLQKFAAGCP